MDGVCRSDMDCGVWGCGGPGIFLDEMPLTILFLVSSFSSFILFAHFQIQNHSPAVH